NLSEGQHSFTITSTDAANNVSGHSAAFTLGTDYSAPDVTLAIDGYFDDVGTNQGLMTGSNGATDDTAPVLSGSWTGDLDSTDKVRIYQDGKYVGDAQIDAVNRTWTYALSGLVNGNTYNWTASAIDTQGNETANSPKFTLSVDLSTPTQTVTIDSYTDSVGQATGEFNSGTSTDDRNPVLNGSVKGYALDDGDVIRIYDVSGGTKTLLGTADVDSSGNWTFKLPALEDNTSYTFKAVVANEVGTEGTISDSFDVTVDLTVNVNAQSTLDTTPIISGSTGFDIQDGEYLQVTVNGQTYSSKNGQVVVDLDNNTWYVQVPDGHALAVGSYNVSAVLYDANGNRIAADDSTNELTISAAPKISFTATGASSADLSTALTISEDGTWRILSNSTVFTQNGSNSTTLGGFSSSKLSGTDIQNQSTFIDYDRDGLMDILGEDSSYVNGQQAFKYNGSSYSSFQIGANGVAGQTNDYNSNTYVWYSAVVGVDLNGDGYVDIVYGDKNPGDSFAVGATYDTSIVLNTNGTVAGFDKSAAYLGQSYNPANAPAGTTGHSSPDRELSGVDLNNDGYVDLVYHGTVDTDKTSAGGTSADVKRLVVVTNGVDSSGNTTLTNTQIVTGAFLRDDDYTYNHVTTMTWSDLNGDGYMDLFLAGMTNQGGGTLGAQSVIYYNDGKGNLVTSTNGVGTGDNVQTMGDNTNSSTSLAVDWNNDGRMDLIEIAGEAWVMDQTTANNALLWINNGVNSATGQVNWKSQTLLDNLNVSHSNYVSGAQTVDLDYDGDQDLVIFRAQGNATSYVENTNQVKDGTSMILRISDKNGINSFYGNTVLLVDEATGKVVSSQVINAQGGNNNNNSTGLVYFYGLDADTTYSAVLLANGNDYGGVGAVSLNTGANTIENVNKTWSGLQAIEANHAYVLTAENGNTAAGASAAGDGSNTTGIVGTGYNDTLFATAGTHIYNGGGGSVESSGEKVWSNTGGMDIVDYKLAGSNALNINLSYLGAQDTGFGHATFKNIEGLAGAGNADTFTGNSANNFFEGRGGNDIFNIASGGQDVLIYKALTSTNNGGNGQDTVNGFTVGTKEATPDADVIDISDMLVGYKADADGAAHYINGKATIDSGDTIKQYLSVTHSGNDSILNIDRDGSGSSYGMTALVTLKNVNVDLETLLANHQVTLS
ncbi:TPA: VCBS repeat-containing protein, partial [Enterobacter cloacae]|nr:VCBS repeat-containing protein [Enterobacter cloacae]